MDTNELPQSPYAELEQRNAELLAALQRADQFITNGIEFGFIRMPDADTPDPANRTPVIVRDAIANATRPTAGKFMRGDRVRKIKGSRWQGRVVGFYSTALTPEGYAVESETEIGSVQIYPAAALEAVGDAACLNAN